MSSGASTLDKYGCRRCSSSVYVTPGRPNGFGRAKCGQVIREGAKGLELAFARLRAAPAAQRFFTETASTRSDGDMEKLAAVAAVLREGPDLELLFIRRAERSSDPWSGHMAFPGGRRQMDDASPIETAIRETREEVALDLSLDAHFIAPLTPLPAVARGKRVPLTIHPFVFGLDQGSAPELIPDPREVQEALWVPLSVLTSPDARSTLSYQHGDQQLELPSINVDGRTIWGLTLRMLTELLEVLHPESSA